MDGWMGYYPTYSPGLPAIVWLKINGDVGFLFEVVMNAAKWLLVYTCSVVCCLSSVMLPALSPFTVRCIFIGDLVGSNGTARVR